MGRECRPRCHGIAAGDPGGAGRAAVDAGTQSGACRDVLAGGGGGEAGTVVGPPPLPFTPGLRPGSVEASLLPRPPRSHSPRCPPPLSPSPRCGEGGRSSTRRFSGRAEPRLEPRLIGAVEPVQPRISSTSQRTDLLPNN